MTAHHPKASMIYATTVATPIVMPPKPNRPEPAGIAAIRAAIAEGRDPITEFQSAVKNERYAVGGLNGSDSVNLMPTRATSATLAAALAAYHAPRTAIIEVKIIAAIRAGKNGVLAIMDEIGVSDSALSRRLIAMVDEGVLQRSKTRPAVYSVAADSIGIAAE